MSEFKIEKGIPLPAARIRRKYFFERMEVGDSVFIAGKRGANISGSLIRHTPKRFTFRAVEGGVRVWRIE